MMTFNINSEIPFSARLLRKILSRYQEIRGVPRLCWWLRRITFPFSPVLVYTPDNLPIIINREDYAQIMLFYFPYSIELQILMKDILHSGDKCLDLGANVGLLSIRMARCVESGGKILAVEPNPIVADQLKKLVSLFFPELIRVVQAGIAGTIGKGRLIKPLRGFSESYEVQSSNPNLGEEDVGLLTIDELINQYLDNDIPDFIKVDIEGNEAFLCESMHDLLSHGERPFVLVEFHPEKCIRRGQSPESIIQNFLNIGYLAKRVLSIPNGYRLEECQSQSVKHENILLITPKHLVNNPRLASKCL